MSRLTITAKSDGAQQSVTIAGRIDEDADFRSLAFAGVSKVIFDLGGVELINSLGVQKWLRFIQTIPASVSITLTRCTVPVVNAMNCVSTFTGGRPAEVLSFCAPYYCSACDKGQTELLDSHQDFPGGKLIAPTRSCKACNAAMELDEVERAYFQFLGRFQGGG